jgi:hypothetical protein
VLQRAPLFENHRHARAETIKLQKIDPCLRRDVGILPSDQKHLARDGAIEMLLNDHLG